MDKGLMAPENLSGLGFDSSQVVNNPKPSSSATAPIEEIDSNRKEKVGFVSGLEAKPIKKSN